MATTDTKVRVTRNCAGCGQPMHLVMDSSGSMWMHDRLVDEQGCWQANRARYEDGTLCLGADKEW